MSMTDELANHPNAREAEDAILRDMGVRGGQGRPASDVRRDGSSMGLLLILGILFGVALVLCGCATVSGLGRDVSAIADGVRAEMSKGGGQ